ncbi:MAG: glycosyl hydrolase family 28-related protein [Candidatus Baltobacteraceae bacterium]
MEQNSAGTCAKGDGVTNDHDAVQQAIADAEGGVPGILYFPPGNYRIESPLVITNDITVIGMGNRTSQSITQFLLVDVNYDLFDVRAANDGVRFAGFAVKNLAKNSPNPPTGIVFHFEAGVQSPEIADVTIDGAPNGVLAVSAGNIWCENVRIVPYDAAPSATFPAGSRYGFCATSVTGGNPNEFRCLNCVVDESGNVNKNVTSAFLISEHYNTLILVSCKAQSTYFGFQSTSSQPSVAQPSFFQLFDCSADSCAFGMHLPYGHLAFIDSCRASNGVVVGGAGGVGILVDSTYSAAGPVALTNNVVSNMPNQGIVLRNSRVSLIGGVVNKANVLGASAAGVEIAIGAGGAASVSGVTVSDVGQGPAIHVTNSHVGAVAIDGVAESGCAAGLIVDLSVSGTFAVSGCALPDGVTLGTNGATTRRIEDTIGANPFGNLLVPNPPAGGSPHTVTNRHSVPATVYLSSAGQNAFTAVTIDGVLLGVDGPAVRVPPGSSIEVSYTGTPTWIWMGD